MTEDPVQALQQVQTALAKLKESDPAKYVTLCQTSAEKLERLNAALAEN